MKIAVYTIALNEEKHVARWYESAKEADLLLIADTGSTDKTRFLAKSLGVDVHEISVVPWRFDVARNASLALIPIDFDICIQLDMDEILEEGWRSKVEEAFAAGNNWPIYKHVTSRSEDGKPRTYQHYFKIHPRKGFIWKYPIHEVVQPTPGTEFKREFIDLVVDHIQDRSKSRKSYLNLLETAVIEEPGDWRMRHYLNREYWYIKDWNKVLSSAYEAMELSSKWDVERASTCMWASEAAHFMNLKKLSIEWAELATSEAPEFYEAWYWRAHLSHLHGDWKSCRDFALKRLKLQRQNHHLVKPDVWNWRGYDLLALSSHKLGLHFDAFTYGELAKKFNPRDDRLEKNLKYYREGLKKEIESQEDISIEDKLENFPKFYYINMARSEDRRDSVESEFKEYGISNFERIEANIAPNLGNNREVHRTIFTSHTKAINQFLETGEDWAVICEDDISLELTKSWNFKWENKLQQLKNLNVNILQMVVITANKDSMIPNLHLRREGIDWGAGAYLLSREGALAILEKAENKNLLIGNVESDLFDGLQVHSEALLTCNLSLGSTFHEEHVEKYHRPSFQLAHDNFSRIE